MPKSGEKICSTRSWKNSLATALVDRRLALEDHLEWAQQRLRRLLGQHVERIRHEVGAAHAQDQVG
jgi:peptidoglycan/xylan/chitin deacetylase (PgdA/CDA1 family)